MMTVSNFKTVSLPQQTAVALQISNDKQVRFSGGHNSDVRSWPRRPRRRAFVRHELRCGPSRAEWRSRADDFWRSATPQ